MKIPKKLRIGGFVWTVEESEKVAAEGNVYGSTHHTKQRFFLEPNENLQKKEQVLLHEVLHAIWHQTGLGKRYASDAEKKMEEEIVHALSMGLYQVIKDNKLHF